MFAANYSQKIPQRRRTQTTATPLETQSSEINGGGPVYKNSSTRVAQWHQLDSDILYGIQSDKIENAYLLLKS